MRPRIVALEGPAGVGKSTVSQRLSARLRTRGHRALVLPEFSSTPLGEALERNAQYGSRAPAWCFGLGGLLAFLADKTHQLENMVEDGGCLWISDRSLFSQYVLGIRGPDSARRSVGTALIAGVQEWAQSVLSEDSVLIFLSAPAPVLQQRLERRLRRPLSQDEQESLRSEAEQYQAISSRSHRWTTICLSATVPLKDLVVEIETRLTK